MSNRVRVPKMGFKMRDEFSRIQFVSRVVKKGVSKGGTCSSKSVMRLKLGHTQHMNISNPFKAFL